ncbi:MAG: excinuclease ABC subunit UvrA [Faecalibacterium sp.]|nr:excinuclease ABC subunit UvrA [Ruminococcus sp.]MCM1392339.1 excinuclease ABC subunit UvrA [Ruminococcus sp.]MCM1484665.1 excinuclease ABC subunit UvrA [Faecalibacterium sp.]
MAAKNIFIKGAREHNLKNVDVTIPRDKLIVFTGLSGSGKSSLAFDTIYAEGQRRYVESLSSYARMFLGQMEKPDVDYIDGLSPAISIDQKTTSKNPRSTVGTITEIYDYLRLLYARIGIPHCTVCGREIKPQTVDQIVEQICKLPERTKFQLLSPIAKGKKGEFVKELEQIRKSGFVRVRIDGITYDLSEQIKLEKNKKHNIEVIVDRLVMKEGIESRLADSVETATKLSGGLLIVDFTDGNEQLYSLNYACPEHGISFDELTPRMFSFNNPFGACKKCSGLGVFMEISEKLVVPNKNLSINQGAINAHGWGNVSNGSIAHMYYTALGKKYGFTLDTPIKDFSEKAYNAILYGTNGEKMKMERPTSFGGGVYYTDFEGIINNLKRRYDESTSETSRAEIEQLMTTEPCPECGGARLSKEALSVTVCGKNIDEVSRMSIEEAKNFISVLPTKLSEREAMIGNLIIKEIDSRLSFLASVGLTYITLSRSAGTLSGGESQRIRLATQLGTSLIGVLYILDEPSIGLHQRDNAKLIDTLKNLRDIGNTLIVVEHDEDTMFEADYIIDVGPGAGINGGNIVCQGTVNDIMNCEESITGQYLSGKKKIPVPETRRAGNGKSLKIHGASHNNLRNIDVDIPLGKLVCVTGVSGSGKSSLVNEVLYKHLANELNRARKIPGKFESIDGLEHLDKVINIDQSPIGRTPRSNPATYTGVFSDIRDLFANTVDAKMKGFGAGRFSFNIKGGRCEACQGDGIVKIEMHFLADIYVPCDVCKGRKYNNETLAVKYKGKSIFDVLEMTVVEGMNFFQNIPKIYNKLKTLYDVGLGYIKIGQPATTLSGGEAQRVKLSTELSKRATGKTIYILDEPTTGLHTADVHRLVNVLHALVDAGNSVVVIEHNLDVIKTADHIIDLGPEGGSGGGLIVAQGTPEEVAETEQSYTGQYLRKMLN